MADLTPSTDELVRRARELAEEMGHALVGSEHLLLAIVEAGEDLAAHRILREVGALPKLQRRLHELLGRG